MAIFLGLICLANSQEINHQLNYGTVFQTLPPLISTSEYWTHSFVIPTDPSVTLTYQVPACDCPKFLPVFQRLAIIHNATVDFVQKTSHKILIQLSDAKRTKSKRSRLRRSLLPFIGQISKGLFGTATASDLERVASHVNHLQSAVKKMDTKFQHQAEMLSSFMQVSNNRMDNAFTAITNNHKVMLELQNELTASIQSIQNFESWLLSELIDQLQFHQTIQSEYDKLYEGFSSLLSGQFSPLLIDRYHLQAVINNIDQTISQRRPTFQLIHRSPAYYYKHADFMVHKLESKILVTVRFPVSDMYQPLNLYKLISFPVPVNDSTTHATSIVDLPDYIAINNAQNVYTTLTGAAFQNCDTDHHYTNCHFNLPMSPISYKTCALLLFQGDKQGIHDFCIFRFRPNVVKPTISPLNATHVMLVNIKNAALQCESQQKSVLTCHYCMVKIPCNCSIISSSHIVQPRFTGCHHMDNNVTISHPVNLILLQKFFGNDAISAIQSNSTFHKPLNISIKPFNFYGSQFSNSMANYKQDHLNLDKMISAAKEDKLIYNSLAETYFDSDILQTDSTFLQYILMITAISLSAVSFIFIIILCKRVKTLSTILALSHQVKHSTESTILPSFVYTNSPSSPTPQSLITQIHEMLPNFNTYILLILATLAFAYFIKVQNSKLKKPVLVLELTNNHTSVNCIVQQLPTCLKHCIFMAPNPITVAQVQFSLRSFIKINWNGFQIQVKNNVNVLTPDVKIQLSIINAYKFQQLLSNKNDPYIIQLWIIHNNYCLPIDVTCCESEIQGHSSASSQLVKQLDSP